MSELRLLNPDELAVLFQLKRRTVLDSLVRKPGFPASVTGQQKPRWLASEVNRYLQQKSAQNAN